MAPAASIGRRAILASNDVVPFVESSDQDPAEVNGPDAVGDLLEPDRVLLERFRDEEQALLEAERPSVGDALHEEMPGILKRRQLARVRPRGGPVERSRRPATQKLVRALVVVQPTEMIEGALLRGQGRTWRSNGVSLQGFVHPFVRAVLLRLPRQDALMLNAKPKPPDVELREAVNPSRGEGHAVVCADGAGQTVLAK